MSCRCLIALISLYFFFWWLYAPESSVNNAHYSTDMTVWTCGAGKTLLVHERQPGSLTAVVVCVWFECGSVDRQLDVELLSRCCGRRLIGSNASTSSRYHHGSAEMKSSCPRRTCVRHQDCDSRIDLAGRSSSGGVKGGLRAAGLCVVRRWLAVVRGGRVWTERHWSFILINIHRNAYLIFWNPTSTLFIYDTVSFNVSSSYL